MTANEIKEKAAALGIVPVIAVPAPEKALPLAKALTDAGLPAIEVTLRNDAAIASIREISKGCPELLLGAGTVLTPDQADAAIEAGADFLVSPGFDKTLVAYCNQKGYVIVPGVATAGEIQEAMALGLDFLKLFPGATLGTAALKQFAGPFPKVRFMVTGGIDETNMKEYLALPNVAAVGGSFPVPKALLASDDWSGITENVRKAIRGMLEFSVFHVGFNSKDAETAFDSVSRLAKAFGLPISDKGASYFAGDLVEVMKKQGRGTNGHVSVGTRDIVRAVAYLERMGFPMIAESAGYDDKGKLSWIYLQGEIAGFAFHLSQK